MDLENLQWVMSTERGRKFVAEVLNLCGAGPLSGTGESTTDFYLFGRRSVGEDLMRFVRMIESDGENDGLALEYIMLREELKRRRDIING